MLRNDLITRLAQHDNDPVTVTINEHAVDIENVTVHDGSIIIVLDPEGVRLAVSAEAP